MISPKFRKFYCQRVEKTASKSLARMFQTKCSYKGSVLNGVSWVEKNLARYELTKDDWDRYYKFGFVRNPYKRAVSYYFHLNKQNENFKPSKRGFLKFVESFEPNGKRKYIQQYDYFVSLDGKIHFDFIGKLENFEKDIRIVLKKIKLTYGIIPHQNVTEYPKDFRWYYTKESYEIVNEKFDKDIKYFDYSFEGGEL